MRRILDHAKMIGAKLTSGPILVGTKLSQYDGDPLENGIESFHLVGALQYIVL